MSFFAELEADVDRLDYRQEMKQLIDDGVITDAIKAAEAVVRLTGQSVGWKRLITNLGEQGLAFSVPDEHSGPPAVPSYMNGDRYSDPAWFWVLVRLPAWGDNKLVWIFRSGFEQGKREFSQPINLGKRFRRRMVPGLRPPQVIEDGAS